MTRVHRLLVLVALAALLGPAGAGAQASAYLALDDPALDDLRFLAAVGLTDRWTSGRTPSRLEAARVVADARRGAAALEAGAQARAALQRLEERFAAELAVLEGRPGPSRTAWLETVRATATLLDSPARGYPNNFLGDVDARANPLAAGRQGRTVVDGTAFGLETTHVLQPDPAVSLVVQPRLEHVRPRDGGADDTDVRVQQAYARVVAGALAVTAGRADVAWGQARSGSLMMSGNARAPWMVKAGTDRPVGLPGFLGALGPVTAEVFWADLGADQNYPGANLVGYHLSARPHPRFEIGAGLLSQYGGEGAPDYSFGGVLQDMALLLSSSRQFSNKLAGLDFRWRFPDAAGLSIYGEIVADDIDMNPNRLPEWIGEDVGHVYGVDLARLGADGRLGAWLEYHHTGVRYYRHPQFTSGVTHERRILGDPLGPDGDGVYGGVRVRLDDGGSLALEGAWERQSRDRYWVEGSDDLFNTFPGDDGWSVYEDFPEERRVRLVATWHRPAPVGGWGVLGRAGWERVGDFAYEAGRDRSNVLLELRVETRYR